MGIMKRTPWAVAVVLPLLAACAGRSAHAPDSNAPPNVDTFIAAFSMGKAGGLPERWSPLIIHHSKLPTEYRLVPDKSKTVLHARAAAASSGLMQRVSIDPAAQPWISWRWRVNDLIDGANSFERHAEDSPVRLILGFDGDKDQLSFSDQIWFETARLLTGRELPYATLMYVWENQAPVGTVIDNTRTARIKMIVAASGADGLGRWREFTRNIVEDYEKAFGGKPGRLIGVGVMTDTDNTGETVEAWYGDIRSFRKR
jgi:hypothetical protein